MKWISVIDDLPEVKLTGDYEKSEFVFVLINSTEPTSAIFEQGENHKGVKWSGWYCPFIEDAIEDVTHWMPIPKLEE